AGSSNSFRRTKSKDTESNNRVLMNTNYKSSSTLARKMPSSVRIDSYKHKTMHLVVCQSNASELNTKIVNAVNDSSNIVCVSCGKTVFMLPHEKCVARYALSKDSRVKRALFTTLEQSVSEMITLQQSLDMEIMFKEISRYVMYTTMLNVQSHIINIMVMAPKAFSFEFCTINQLTSKDLVDGLSKFKYDKDLVAACLPLLSCEQGKSKKASFLPKLVPSTESKLELLHMDLYGPMRVESINGKKYILVIVDDYSQYTWVYFLRSKAEPSNVIINFINQVQRNLKAQILNIKTDNGTEFKNKKLRSFYVKLVSSNSAVNTLDDANTRPSSLIIFEDSDALQIVTSLEEPITQESSTPVLETYSDEKIQEDIAKLDGNTSMHSFEFLDFEEAESSSNYHDSSNMHECSQQHRYTNKWTKNHPIEQEAMLDHRWIESMQDELNQFIRLDAWELFQLPEVFSNRFFKLMKENFEMSMMGEMKFFLRLQIHQCPHGIFINQSQYTMELPRKHEMKKCDTVTIPMATTKIDADLHGTLTDQTKYRSMIGGLMYFSASRPDIAFATFECARYQARSTKKHLKEVKRIFRYLRQSINKGLWIGMRCMTSTELERLAKLSS
nr:uncharacterized mitochondrial protein AtMg00810-like [Tanacetum cinerariifolium]